MNCQRGTSTSHLLVDLVGEMGKVTLHLGKCLWGGGRGFSMFNVVKSFQTMYFIFTVCFYVGMPSRLFYFFCFTCMQAICHYLTIKSSKYE